MANVNVYTIRSILSDRSEVVNSTTVSFIEELNKNSSHTFTLVDELEKLDDADLGLYLVETGGSEEKFKLLSEKKEGPYYLLTNGLNNSLAASLEILSYLKKIGRQGEVLHGSISYIVKRVDELINELITKNTKKYYRLGVIGKPSDWLISCEVNPERIKELFDVELVDLTTQELIFNYCSINPKLPEDRLKASYNKEELNKAYRVYKALKQLIKDHQLDAITLRCFDLISAIKTTACLGLALLNEKGFVASCEGDIPAMMTAFLINKVLNKPAFQANPCQINLEEKKILFAHCTLPLNMVDTYQFDTHFESGIGVGIHGELHLEDVTVARLSSDMKYFYVGEGKIIRNQFERNLCRTQIEIQFDDDISYFLKNPLGNHHLICYGHSKGELIKYLTEKGLKEVD